MTTTPADALCFTAGYSAAPFACGAIHAYLVADRPAPALAGGISIGAVTAAVLRRCFREKRGGGSGFEFLQRYMKSLERASEIFWGQPSEEEIASTDGGAETEARRIVRARLVRLLSQTDVTVAEYAMAARSIVRAMESAPSGAPQRRAELVRVVGPVAKRLLRTVRKNPQWEKYGGSRLRPLIGTAAWSASSLFSLMPENTLGEQIAKQLLDPKPESKSRLARLVGRGTSAVVESVAASLLIDRSLVGDFGARRWLSELFGTEERVGSDSPDDIALVVTATPLELLFRPSQVSTDGSGMPLEHHAYQLWAKPHVALFEALGASIALAPWYPPRRATLADWGPPVEGPSAVHLVDGAVIRENPLPAMFLYLNAPEHAILRERLMKAADSPGIRLVYGVPVEPNTTRSTLSPRDVDIVSVAQAGLRLAQRRDTRLEVVQANFVTEITERLGPSARHLPILVDEIAPLPTDPIGFEILLAPHESEITGQAAAGCRATLGRLYRDEIQTLAGTTSAPVPCAVLLSAVAPQRAGAITSSAPGSATICSRCTKVLVPRERVTEALPISAAMKKAKTSEEHDPQIVFVASGGVFRGTFQVGVIAALQARGVRPDLVVGASIGSIMGAACAALAAAPPAVAPLLLDELVEACVNVRDRVALTEDLRSRLRRVAAHLARVTMGPADSTAFRAFLQALGERQPRSPVPPVPADAATALERVLALDPGRLAKAARLITHQRVGAGLREIYLAVRHQTIARADATHEVMGTSLLRQLIQQVLRGAPLQQPQPFGPAGGPWVFMTATNLVSEAGAKLGLDNSNRAGPYSFVNALLASSAFPVVFAPVPEDGVYPHSGQQGVWFSDGGMFDNFPFIPTIQLLSHIQQANATGLNRAEYLQARVKAPHLVIAAALDPDLETEPRAEPGDWSLAAVLARIGRISANVKVRATQWTAQTGHTMLGQLAGASDLRPDDASLDTFVDAAVLPIFPADTERLNGTFAFSRTTGYDRNRMLRSIAHGCFQTHAALAGSGRDDGTVVSITALRKSRRLPGLSALKGPPGPEKCAYFGDPSPVACPFAPATGQSLEVHAACVNDRKHRTTVTRPS